MSALKDFLHFQYTEVETISTKKKLHLVKDQISDQIFVCREVPSSMAAFYSCLKQIHHRNLVQIFEIYNLTDTCIIIEEYINGIRLDILLEKERTFSEEIAIHYTAELCSALQALHEQRLVHRNISMANIRITTDGILKLMNFDCVRQIAHNKIRDTVLLGTAGYAAPEQFGFYESDNRTDIYAVGVLLNQLLTGELPSQKLYDGSRKITSLITRCTELDKQKRLLTVEQVTDGLTQTYNGYMIQNIYQQLPGLNSDKWYMKCAAFAGYILFWSWFLKLVIQHAWPYSIGSTMLSLMRVLIGLGIPVALITNVGKCDTRLLKMFHYPCWLRILCRCLLGLFLFFLALLTELIYI